MVTISVKIRGADEQSSFKIDYIACERPKLAVVPKLQQSGIDHVRAEPAMDHVSPYGGV